MAAAVLGAPVSLVSLLSEDGRIFERTVRFPERQDSRPASRPSRSFCHHVVASGAALVVERAPGHPLVRSKQVTPEPGSIAYVGLPLVTSDSIVMGSLCVVDTKPRRWGDAELGLLRDLVAPVMAEIELRAQVAELTRSEEVLRRSEARYRALVEDRSQIVWTADAAGETVEVQPSWSDFTGQSDTEQAGWGWFHAIHPEDRARTAEVWLRALDEEVPYSLEQRVLRHDGAYRNLRVHAVPVREPDGTVREWVGAESDVTEERAAPARQSDSASAYERHRAGPDPAAGPGARHAVGDGAEQRSIRFQDGLLPELGPSVPSASGTLELLRIRIQSSLYLGTLRGGDRLPSVRNVAASLGVPFRSAVNAYARLEFEGLIEKRDRSGTFVVEDEQDDPAGETAGWMAEMLTAAFSHGIRVPQLRQTLHQWTAGVPLRCACVESTTDRLVALSDDVTRYFGVRGSSVRADDVLAEVRREGDSDARGPRALADADLVLTTPFFASRLRPVAARVGKPLVVATLHPGITAAVLHQLACGAVTVVCVDSRFGEQLTGLAPAEYRGRFRVILAEDADAVAQLRPEEPILLTRAAQPLVSRTDLRLLVPLSPHLSPESARRLGQAIIRLNREKRQRF